MGATHHRAQSTHATEGLGAGLVTLRWAAAWPDLVVGLGIAFINADAAKTVLRTARDDTLPRNRSVVAFRRYPARVSRRAFGVARHFATRVVFQ
jgi:hypothetical protein